MTLLIAIVVLVGNTLYHSNVRCEVTINDLIRDHQDDAPRLDIVAPVGNGAFDWKANAKRVQEWRESLAESVRNGETIEVDRLRRQGFQSKVIFPCDFTFLDLGANVGDTLRKMIDSGFPAVDGKQYFFEFEKAEIGSKCYGCPLEGRPRPDYWTFPQYMQQNMKGRQPEDYCYYGVEGNPVFSSRLKDIEIQVMNMDPRPVRHAHFLTEHIGTNVDGPSVLYLDTFNTEDNFWGSSIYQSHWDVEKSGKNTGTRVMGITLTTLLKKTVKRGGHVIVKIDIEGAEYVLLEEAVTSNILCELIQETGVTVSMVIEPHVDEMLGGPGPRLRWEGIQGDERIRKCGVSLHVGDMDVWTETAPPRPKLSFKKQLLASGTLASGKRSIRIKRVPSTN